MTAIHSNMIQGGSNGSLVEAETMKAINIFFSLGVSKIQEELNRVARGYILVWNSRKPLDFMSELGLPTVPYSKGIDELSIPFVLFEPREIFVDVVDSFFTPNKLMPANQRFTNPEKDSSLIRIFLGAFRIKDEQIELIYNPMTPFSCVIYHELLHACGDTTDLRGIVDGAIRHSMIGCEAIMNLEKASQ